MLAWEATLAGLMEFDDPEPVIPVLASALVDPILAPSALERLLSIAHGRAPREIVRKYHYLSDAIRHPAIARAADRLLPAAHQLVGSDHVQTRANVAHFLCDAVTHGRIPWEEAVTLLLVLIDDPRVLVRDKARRAFLVGLGQQPAVAVARGSRFLNRNGRELRADRSLRSDPILRALSILLRRLDQHRDSEVIRRLFERGIGGFDVVGAALGENREAVHKAVGECIANTAEGDALTVAVEALFHWLRSPFSATRDAARKILRERRDPSFLVEVVTRLEHEHGDERDREYPVYRHVRWDLLPPEAFGRLSIETQRRIVHYLEAANEPPDERGRRLSRVLAMASAAVQKDVLTALREHSTGGNLDALAPALRSDDPEIQLLATELLDPDGSRAAFTLLIQQLGSPHEPVRAAAQRKLGGQSLAILFDAFDSLRPSDRRHLLPILARVDLHFSGQLRRALRSNDEKTVILAIRTIIDGDWVTTFEDTLFDLTVNPSAKIRATLARIFVAATPDAAAHYLRLFLSDADSRVVANSIESLDELDDPRSRSWIDEFRDHPVARVRANSLLALGRRGDAKARADLERLAEASDEPTEDLARSARWALAELRSAA